MMHLPQVINGKYYYVVETQIAPDGGKFPKIYGGTNWSAEYIEYEGQTVAVVRASQPLSSAKTLDIPLENLIGI